MIAASQLNNLSCLPALARHVTFPPLQQVETCCYFWANELHLEQVANFCRFFFSFFVSSFSFAGLKKRDKYLNFVLLLLISFLIALKDSGDILNSIGLCQSFDQIQLK